MRPSGMRTCGAAFCRSQVHALVHNGHDVDLRGTGVVMRTAYVRTSWKEEGCGKEHDRICSEKEVSNEKLTNKHAMRSRGKIGLLGGGRLVAR